jgi:predicted ATPase
MEGKRFIRRIRLTNLLSFGPKGEEVELGPLNVLIGPNNSGKSNFTEALWLLQALRSDLAAAFRKTSAADWIWKGGDPSAAAHIEVRVSDEALNATSNYYLAFARYGDHLRIVTEGIGTDSSPHGFYEFTIDQGAHVSRDAESTEESAHVPEHMMSGGQSALAQFRGPSYPQLTRLADMFDSIKLFRIGHLGPDAPARRLQKTDLPGDYLDEDGANLWMVLNELENTPDAWSGIIRYLKRFYEPTLRVSFRVLVNTVQMLLHERGLNQPIPAVRLSDGTLRFLCLLAILCHPEPPPLVVIEEPELGLHPDALGLVAELLVEASKRMQLVVTTHSPSLVASLSDVPDAVLVCERDDEGTHFRRPADRKGLDEWLERYSLGDLWLMGEIGGNP